MSTGKTVLYFTVATHFWFACYYDWNYVKVPPSVHPMGVTLGKTNKLKFLTYWDALLQAFFFTIAFLNEIIGNAEISPPSKRTPLLRKFKDLLLSSLAFPMSMFVGLTFWSLYVVDRELVFPRAIDPYFPTWLNHVMHTNIMIFMFLELFMSFRRYPSKLIGMSILIVFQVSYLVWIHVIYSKTGIWVYPILDVLNLPLRAVFFIGLLGLSVILYLVGEKINQIFWFNRKTYNVTKEQ